MSASGTGSTHIDRPVDDVWRQLTALDGLTGWYDDWDRCEHDPIDRQLRVGLAFRLHARQPWRSPTHCLVVTVDAPSTLRWIEHRPLHAPVLVEFTLQAATAYATVVTHTKTAGRLRRTPETAPS